MTIATQAFSQDLLKLDAAAEVDRICDWMRETVAVDFKRKGLVLGLSGGIDSTVCAALAVKALGPERLFGIMMPERDSEADSLVLA
jgi:NAD+ synthase